MSISMTFSSSFLRPRPTLMTAPLPSPATDVNWQAQGVPHQPWHWTTSSPGGSRWQVSWAPDKTQTLLISAGKTSPTCLHRTYGLRADHSPLKRSSPILGVEFKAGLTFTSHARRVAKNSAWRLSCVRRISHLLECQGGWGFLLQGSGTSPNGILPPSMVFLPPPLTWPHWDHVQRRAHDC
ncbi:hypothetical protein GWK47_040699 [Chionoecetes opilio]|uniref:Uncharacterized protein n=1 Tax=Chionoecetes opilio TaxID=41210 RepID=A0A8J4YJ87_CHIOP|nr:hypothetical protein GWK47_040699 [Chionoecetes opilio]